MKQRLFLWLCAAALGLFLAGLVISPVAAAQAAADSLRLCAGSIIPALFPFMVVSGCAVSLGLASAAGRRLQGLARLFSLSGAGLSAFLLGLMGGYPLGAATVSELYVAGQLGQREAQRLLRFCDNCGPAFSISFAGTAIFGDVKYGLFLFGVHCLSAIALAFFHRKPVTDMPVSSKSIRLSPAEAFTEAVKKSALTCLGLCGFVVFFGVALGLLAHSGLLPKLCGEISARFGLELHFVKSALCGLFELGAGISSMQGLRASAPNLALASFILGWGGLSVQAQAASVIKKSGLNAAPHFLGKLEHGALAAIIAFLAFKPVF